MDDANDTTAIPKEYREVIESIKALKEKVLMGKAEIILSDSQRKQSAERESAIGCGEMEGATEALRGNTLDPEKDYFFFGMTAEDNFHFHAGRRIGFAAFKESEQRAGF